MSNSVNQVEKPSKSDSNKQYYEKNKLDIAKFNMLKRYQAGANVSERTLKELGFEELIDEVSIRRSERSRAHGCDNFKYSREKLMDILDKAKDDYKAGRGVSNVKLYLGYLLDSLNGPEDDVFLPLKQNYKKFNEYISNIKKKKGGAISNNDKSTTASSMFSLMINNRTDLYKYFSKKQIEFFNQVRDSYKDQIEDDRQIRNETQSLSYSMNEFDTFRDKIIKSETKADGTISLRILLLSLYSYRPPVRNDYVDVLIVNKDTKKHNLKKYDKDKQNYFNIETGIFTLNDYKTDRSYHQQQIPFYGEKNTVHKDYMQNGFVNFPKLEKMIKSYHKGHDYKYLLGDIKPNKSVIKIMDFPDTWNGGNLSSIRKAFITRFYQNEDGSKLTGNGTHIKKKELAKLMLHSKDTATNVYNFHNNVILTKKENDEAKEKGFKLVDKKLVKSIDNIEKLGDIRIKNYGKKEFESVPEKDRDYEQRVKDLIKQFNYKNRVELENFAIQ